MKTFSKITLALAIGLTSCTHYYYMPNVQNVPLFTEKNEYRLAYVFNNGDEIFSSEVQSAYSITNNLAVTANFMMARGGNVSSNNWGKGKYIDGAIGYYKPFTKVIVFEIYGGFGVGNQYHQYNQDLDYSKLSLKKYFIQPSLGITHKAFDIAFSTRLCNLSFYNIENQIVLYSYDFERVDLINKNRNSNLVETAITVRGGWEFIKGQVQIGSSYNLSNPNLNFEKSYGSLGFYLTFSKKLWPFYKKRTIL